MRGLRILLGTTVLSAGLALAPVAQTQLVVDIGVPPVCSYGYYDYAPYACAPYGFYGPGYFYGGVFLGMGPWRAGVTGTAGVAIALANGGGGSYRGGAAKQLAVAFCPWRREVRSNGGGQSHANVAANHSSGRASQCRSSISA